MPNVRSTSFKKYKISPHRFMELYHFCLQYREWKFELDNKTDALKSVQITDMPMNHAGISDSTQQLAIRRMELTEKIDLIDQTVKEADPDIAPWLLLGVTEERMSFVTLDVKYNIPCGKDLYYDRRRRFYWLLDKKLSKS